jgi:hypothetical protein
MSACGRIVCKVAGYDRDGETFAPMPVSAPIEISGATGDYSAWTP